MASTQIKMVVNRGATISTQTLESLARSSDEVPWIGISVTLLKENNIWLIIDLKRMHPALKHNFLNIPAIF